MLNFISFDFEGQKGEIGQPGLVGLSGETGAKGSWFRFISLVNY